MKNALIALATLFYLNAFPQTPNWSWAKHMGGPNIDDISYAIALDDSGNIYTTGTFRGTVDFDPGPGVFNLTQTGGDDIFISKLDNAGNFCWAKKIGSITNDVAYAITVDHFGNIYTTGSFPYGATDFDPGINTYILTGTGSMNVFISKLNSLGNFVWAKQLGGTNNSSNQAYGHAITVDDSGYVYTTGNFKGTADFDPGPGAFNMGAPMASIVANNAFVSKLDSAGNFVWAVNIGLTGEDYGRTIALDASGDICVGGDFTYTVDFDPGPATYNLSSSNGVGFILKLNPSGNFVWAKNMGAPCSALTTDAGGNVITTGSFNGAHDFDPGPGTYTLNAGSGGFDIFICKLTSLGDFVWAKRIGGSSPDNGNAIASDAQGNIYTTGNFNSTVDFDPDSSTFNLIPYNGSTDVFVSKLDSSGNFVWAKSAGGTSGEIGYSIVLDSIANVYISGYFNSPFSFFGQTTLVNADTVNTNQEIFVAKLNSAIITNNTDNEDALNNFLLFPNPVKNELKIDGLKMAAIKIEIFDMIGNEIISLVSKGNESALIDISNLTSGIYFVSVRDEKNNLTVRKFVKM